MKRPVWSNAPISAQYLAKDGDGNYSWHTGMPIATGNMRWLVDAGHSCEHAGMGPYDGKMILEKRP